MNNKNGCKMINTNDLSLRDSYISSPITQNKLYFSKLLVLRLVTGTSIRDSATQLEKQIVSSRSTLQLRAIGTVKIKHIDLFYN